MLVYKPDVDTDAALAIKLDGKQAARFRRNKGVTQSELAAALGVSKLTIFNREHHRDLPEHLVILHCATVEKLYEHKLAAMTLPTDGIV